ncbi:MAG: hypothetical protein GF393_00400 [Armatimonadia bacterium]|nr:hypothetical protein [Armatimonadia bacterium]
MAVAMVINAWRSAMAYVSVSEAARRLDARPRDISDLLYRRQLSDDRCPLVGNRRLIPEDYLDVIAMVLRRTGRPVRPAEDRRHG